LEVRPVPTAAPTPEKCVQETGMDIVQEGDFGEYTPSEEIIKLLQQSSDGTSVVVQLNQAWKLTGTCRMQ